MKMTVTEKPWGREVLVALNNHYALKDIYMIAGTRSSLQSHRRKVETIYVISGQISVELQPSGAESVIILFGPGDAYDVQPGTVHRVTVLEDARLIEVSTPDLSDLIRHEDDFGRV